MIRPYGRAHYAPVNIISTSGYFVGFPAKLETCTKQNMTSSFVEYTIVQHSSSCVANLVYSCREILLYTESRYQQDYLILYAPLSICDTTASYGLSQCCSVQQYVQVVWQDWNISVFRMTIAWTRPSGLWRYSMPTLVLLRTYYSLIRLHQCPPKSRGTRTQTLQWWHSVTRLHNTKKTLPPEITLWLPGYLRRVNVGV